jgi:uncharacterized protein YqgV (UPF0045/DUF77 family)
VNAALDARPPAEAAEAPVRVACQWAIYPLGREGHMPQIYDAIARTKRSGVFTRGQHFVSRLDGELSEVFAAIRTAFEEISGSGGHVVAHATFSANSPSTKSAAKTETGSTQK